MYTKKSPTASKKCHIRNNNNTYWKIVRVNGMDFVDWVNWIKLKSTNHEKEKQRENNTSFMEVIIAIICEMKI